jgi:hypothetical protein
VVMPIRIADGWISGDAAPVPAEGLYLGPSGPTQILMPAKQVAADAYRSPVIPERCKVTRGAIANFARSRWGPAATSTPWSPAGLTYDAVRPQLEALLSHRFWERFDVIGSLVHLALPRQEAAVTIDLVVRFEDGGGLGLLDFWPGPPSRIAEAPQDWRKRAQGNANLVEALRLHDQAHAKAPQEQRAPWAELGAGVAAMADAQIPVEKAVVVWSGAAGVQLEAKPAQEALDLWVDAVSLARAYRLGFGRQGV